MPNIKSAVKRVKTAERRRGANKAVKSRIGTLRRALTQAVADGNSTAGEKAFRDYCSAVDKAAKRGAIKKNAASRRKARAAKRLAALEA